ncbi:MAG: hypothetical protein M1823_000187 [Watsoniomyces obsoletus]|nr:MAG: hypothetical protein M1823_000187 [Watsoniomyces obsoletus]
MILSSKDYHEKASEIVHAGLKNPPVLETMNQSTTHPLTNSPLEMPAFETSLDIDRSGLMLYTSGTTGRPKGVLLPQAALMAQCRSLVEAWKYSANDYLLHILPLHHIHGIINGLLAPLLAGSSIEFLYPFNPTSVWHRLAAPYLPKTPQQQSRKITIFTAVPTMYNRLLPTFPELPTDIQEAAIEAISPDNLRLNMSGSSALPTSIKTAWTKLSKGNVLLERYGMTEIGMALSCGMDMSERLDGSVGWPLPSVDVGLLDTETNEIIPPNGKNLGNEREGEIIVNGPTVFQEYWRKEDKTRESFVIDKETGKKWFKTGDIAVRKNVVNPVTGKLFEKGPMYFIRGRKDVDIIKTGGEKVSALEVERELLSLPGIAEVAVVAVPSTIWGQKVAAVIVLDDTRSITNTTSETPAKSQWTPVEIRRALKDRLANFKIPQMMKILKGRGEELPRNVMGKVNKKNLVEHYWGSSEVDATEK